MHKSFVLGIDGLPFTLARRLIKEGLLPNLGYLSRRGTLAQMHTTVPDFSCVAWTSFATGVNPGKHGIYGFVDFHPKTGEKFMPTVTECRAPALWHEVGRAGGRSIIFNLPGTYPALPLRGKMVSGFVAVDFERSCYPGDFANTLRGLDYRMDLDGQTGLVGSDHIAQCIRPVFDARKRAIRHIIDNESWDLCVAVITETDRLQHFFLHAVDDPGHPRYEWTRQFYVELDRFIGEVADKLEGKVDLFLVSDHGFSVVRHLVVMQDFLKDLGMSPASDVPCWTNPEIAAKTHVFCLDPARFYINRKNGRFPGGFVEEDEAEEILNRLTRALLDLRDPISGESMVSTVRRKEEGFWGGELDYAPDLVASTNPGYYFRGFVFPDTSKVRNVMWEANHVWDDAIVCTPYSLAAEKYQPMVWDVLPSALARMGLSLPHGIDGHDLAITRPVGG
jgi:predicted AlkP superfamily phosphohydrolase/phosphomutase